MEALRTPALLIDVDVAERNASRMLDHARRLGCRLRPHVKTHKTVEGALLQTGGVRECITVVSARVCTCIPCRLLLLIRRGRDCFSWCNRCCVYTAVNCQACTVHFGH
jgi:hypothetical protein